MFIQLSYYIFYIHILIIFTSTSVYGYLCRDDDTTCDIYPDYWCCSSDEYCGSYSRSCFPRILTTARPKPIPSSEIRWKLPIVFPVISIIGIFVFFYRVVCLPLRQQCLHSSVVTNNNQRVLHSNRPQPMQTPVQVVLARPVYDGVSETPPPSYEAAIVKLPPPYSSVPPSPPIAETAEQTDSRVYFN